MTTASPLSLHWLPPAGDFDAALAALRRSEPNSDALLDALTGLAGRQIDFMQSRRLDRYLSEAMPKLSARAPRLRLALLGSSTLDHLVPGIRIGALRRGLLLDVEVAPYGQWRQQILDPGSSLYTFKPEAVLLALDQASLLPDLPLSTSAEQADAAVDAALEELSGLWQMLRDRAQTAIIQQTLWSDELPLFGHFERQVAASPAALAAKFDARLADCAAGHRVLLLDLRTATTNVGMERLSDPKLWHHAKQAISPMAAPWLGDQVGRILAAIRGLSKKVAVLDLDNTLWGGVIGDDGLEGIVLGQGSGNGEAFLSFQRYLKRLTGRGILLAVSSKNDQKIAEAAFDDHPEMILRRSDFAAFEANWNDKPSAVRRIARDLDLGLDSLVFIDDNPAERDLMRRTLPMVAVPELPEAPELYARCIADAGYFEAISFTADDAKRNEQYVANRERRQLQASATDMETFLRELQMTLTVSRFQPADLARVTQLINKTNQFNLTTRRYTEAEVRAMMEDPSVLTYAGRLVDRFGDNGLTSIVIGRVVPDDSAKAIELDTWLMSCRVLGRRVEHAMLSVVAQDADAIGAAKLIGRYRPTPKNGLVKEHYPNLGFAPVEAGTSDDGETVWMLPLGSNHVPPVDHMKIVYRRE